MRDPIPSGSQVSSRIAMGAGSGRGCEGVVVVVVEPTASGSSPVKMLKKRATRITVRSSALIATAARTPAVA
jgi:hypothetical protein